MATPRRISDFKPTITNLAQTSHYEVKFGGLPSQLSSYLGDRGISSGFVGGNAGLLCCSAVLPTTQFATIDIPGNYTGITQSIPHRRVYQDLTLEFYVDSNYGTIKFIEHWMEFIASGASNPRGYSIRMQYPEYYKSDKTSIVKFERDYGSGLEYTFIGLYPYNIASIPLSYAQSDILKMQASFKIDRYVIGKSASINYSRNDDNNKVPTQSQSQPRTASQPRPRLVPRSPGSIPSNGVELFPFGQTLGQSIEIRSSVR